MGIAVHAEMVNTCSLPSPAQWACTEANEHDAIAFAKICNIFDSITCTYMLRARIKRGNIGKPKVTRLDAGKQNIVCTITPLHEQWIPWNTVTNSHSYT